MSKPPLISSGKCIKALQKIGFVIDRQRGSHIILVRDDPKPELTISVPNRREIPRGTLRNIIKQAGLTIEAFIELLD